MRVLMSLVAGFVLMAASASDVVVVLEDQGFFIEDGSNASEQDVSDSVAEARFAGSAFYAVTLSSEPPSGATFFSDQVLSELGDGTVITVGPESVGWASDGDIWERGQLEAALDDSLDGSSDSDIVLLFVESLTGADVGDAGTDGGGGGSGLLLVLVIGGGLVALFLFLRSRSASMASAARRSRLEDFRTAAQAKLDDIANDILEMEDEVELAGNPEVTEHYQRASATYARLVDRVPTATADDDLVGVTQDLDIAIWELDVAEALLDDKSPPARPEEPVVETAGGVEPRPDRAPAEPFDRRPQRRSTPTGPDLGNILLAILAARGMGGIGGPGGWTGAPRSGGGGRSMGGGGRMRGGGRRRG